MTDKAKTAEYGDFQTPAGLARSVCAVLKAQGVRPASLLEPTCGVGGFLLAGLHEFPELHSAFGADINADYVKQAERALPQRPDAHRARLVVADCFQIDWASVIAELPEPVLILGNLPWVTNAHLGRLSSRNLPEKSNVAICPWYST